MSIEQIEINATEYLVTLQDGSNLQTLEITEGVQLDVFLSEMGLQGPAGPAGKGVTSIVKTSTAGLVDTYTITYSDSTTQTFTVTNGTNGTNGRGIVSISRTSGTGAAGTTDTYTITYSDATTSTFNVYNGANGTGSVNSVAMSVPTGLSVSGSPITTSGTLEVTYAAGYSIPTTVKQGQWDAAYGWGNHALAGYLTSAAIGNTVQPLDADLTAIAALTGTTGLLKKTATNTWVLDTTGYSTLALGTSAGAALAASGSAGSATTAAKSDHVHPYPSAASLGVVASTGGTASGLVLNDGYTEEVFAVSGTAPALSPTNGSIQTWTLTGNATPTAGTWASGQSMTLMVDDGSAYTINWASMGIVWKTNGGTAPTLLTSGYTVITLWKVGTTLYGARVGDA